ncbi:MAG: hypothetical protein COA86_03200 [Kangiella sp.]|nr:MAG: hypothetical protein COA86_03200 [Kangiella sp.]
MSTYNVLGNFPSSNLDRGIIAPQRQLNTSSSAHTNESVVTRDVRSTSLVENGSQVNTVKLVEHAQPTSNLKTKEEINNQIEELQQFNQSIDRSLQFKIDEELGVTIVRVVDKETDELIRQFPPEELINLSRRLKEVNEQKISNSGVLLEERV